MRLVYDWGINDSDYVTRKCPIYRCWKDMLRRCYHPKHQERNYVGCKVDERWRRFMAFRTWYLEQAPKLGEQLDKDYLGNGKLYSPETCCFVSRLFNTLFTDHGAKRGEWPQGVDCKIGKYRAQLRRKGKRVYLGLFDTPKEASAAYLKAKAAYVEDLLVKFPQPPRLAAAIWRKMVELIEQEERND